MYFTYEIELVGDNEDRLLRDFSRLEGALSGNQRKTPWFGPVVLEILGIKPDNKLDCKWTPFSRDFSRANSKGSRGVYAQYVLKVGSHYKVRKCGKWGFWQCTERGLRNVEEDEVRRVVANMPPAAEPEEKVSRQDKRLKSKGWKRHIGVDVLTAARNRIDCVFREFPNVYLSFSGGKDSTVMLHLAAEIARERGRKFACLLVDLESQYSATIEHARKMFEQYKDVIEPYWLCLPLSLRNAVSQFEPQWQCWDPDLRKLWVRDPPDIAITDPWMFPWFRRGMEFEDLVAEFGTWYGRGQLTCCLVGIRTDESLNRWRAITGKNDRFLGRPWTTRKAPGLYNAYPIYDWHSADIWTFHARTGLAYNPVYDLMHLAGVPQGHMRICQPYGDDQKRGLWLYQLLEPDNWPKVLARVSGANSGALYSKDSGHFTGRGKLTKPKHLTWQEYSHAILQTMPPGTREHYETKIGVFLKWYADRGYPDGIPDEADPKEEAARKAPSWRRVAKVLLKNDWWCKGLSMGQHASGAYERYMKVRKARESQWRHLLNQ